MVFDSNSFYESMMSFNTCINHETAFWEPATSPSHMTELLHFAWVRGEVPLHLLWEEQEV